MRCTPRVLLFAELCLLAGACSAPGEGTPRATLPERRGPLPERVNAPLSQTFLALRPRAAATAAPGGFELRVQSAYSSIFEVGSGSAGAVSFDGELWRTAALLRTGLGARTDIEIELPFVYASSGFLDVFIETWHAILGLPDQGRDTRPRFEYDMRVTASGTEAYALEDDRFGLADVPLVLTQRVVDETASAPAIFLQAAVEFPTGSDERGFGNGELDWGLGAGLEKSFGDWILGGGLAWVARGDPAGFEAAGLEVRDGLSARADLEWRWVERSSLLLGLRYEKAISDSLGIEELGADVLELDLGLVLDGAGGTRWLAGFSEDVIAASGPDFTVFVGLQVGL
ncbi:MAG: DUF3187 family protein [Planctomycetes bacterium]|nr:DUF3187 family protein [Planctomycetota bacterium]